MKFFKRNQPTDSASESEPAAAEKPSGGFYTRLKSGLGRTGDQLASGLGDLFLGAKTLDRDLLDAVETELVMADVGIRRATLLTS
jgi:fused signal recognition particle receptor